MKKCTICKQKKKIIYFGNNKSRKDGKQSYCKLCSSKKDKQHYKTSQYRRHSVAVRRDNKRNISNKYIYNWLLFHPCVDCGESDPIVLEFDHTEQKEFDISQGKDFSLEKIKNEIDKCVIRCANCHRRKTAKENNWYSYQQYVQGYVKC